MLFSSFYIAISSTVLPCRISVSKTCLYRSGGLQPPKARLHQNPRVIVNEFYAFLGTIFIILKYIPFHMQISQIYFFLIFNLRVRTHVIKSPRKSLLYYIGIVNTNILIPCIQIHYGIRKYSDIHRKTKRDAFYIQISFKQSFNPVKGILISRSYFLPPNFQCHCLLL